MRAHEGDLRLESSESIGFILRVHERDKSMWIKNASGTCVLDYGGTMEVTLLDLHHVTRPGAPAISGRFRVGGWLLDLRGETLLLQHGTGTWKVVLQKHFAGTVAVVHRRTGDVLCAIGPTSGLASVNLMDLKISDARPEK